MFTPYTPIDRCVGKEISVRFYGENYTGMLAGIYHVSGMPILVITPLTGGGTEQHIPMAGAVVTIKPDK